MKEMKREKVNIPAVKRKTVASKKLSWGVIAAVFGVMIATVAKGMKLDKEEQAKQAAEQAEEENKE